MKKLPLVAAFLLSGLLICTSFTPKKPGKQPVTIQITMVQKTGQLWANMTFTNQSAAPVYLNKLDIGMSPRLMNNLFILQQKGQEVPYAGILVKRRPPTQDDFVLLPPGKSVKTTIRLDQSYAFKSGKNRYSIQYRHYHSSPKDAAVFHEFTSKRYYFDYAAANLKS
ncbi:hypothetical protein GCM10028803_26070 [Larkinella knui]|uniref:Uncharacterized protein n=1 Tax=Larkinella knui TaxID=2025310 RepID=A0A3P1CX42_9BACT|nr:hypothetical protein [Larkinella knui]RRB17656.1 hypothetical protein EHT87_05070 [Larkinella knui]